MNTPFGFTTEGLAISTTNWLALKNYNTAETNQRLSKKTSFFNPFRHAVNLTVRS